MILYLYHPSAIENATASCFASVIAVNNKLFAEPDSIATFAFDIVDSPATTKLFPIFAEPDNSKSSKPIASRVMLPDTVRSPTIETFPVTLVVPSTYRFLSTVTFVGKERLDVTIAEPSVVQSAELVSP